MRYVWTGSPSGRRWTKLQAQLAERGLVLVKRYEEANDIPDRFRGGTDVVIIHGSGAKMKRAVAAAKASGLPYVFPTGYTPGPVMRALAEAGLRPRRKKNLHGFFDEDRAADPGPVSTPVLTPEDIKRLREPKESPKKPLPPPTPLHDPEPVWVEGEDILVGRFRKKPIVVGDDFYASGHDFVQDVGIDSWVGSKAIELGEFEGKRIRRATLEEALARVPGAFHDPDRDQVACKNARPFPVFLRDGEVWVVASDTNRSCRPVFVGGDVFLRARDASELLGVHRTTVSSSILEGEKVLGFEARYATLEEALTLPGAVRDTDRDRGGLRIVPDPEPSAPEQPVDEAPGKDPVTVPTEKSAQVHAIRAHPVATTRPAPSRLVTKIHEHAHRDRSPEHRIASIQVLLEYEADENGRLVDRIRELVNGVRKDNAEVVISVVQELLNWELGA